MIEVVLGVLMVIVGTLLLVWALVTIAQMIREEWLDR